MRIVACWFKRTKEARREDGLAILNPLTGEISNVIDKDSDVVKDIHDIKLVHHLLSIEITLGAR